MTALDCTRGTLVDAACLAGARVRVLRDERGGWSCSLRRRNEPMILRAGSTPQEAMDAVEAVLQAVVDRFHAETEDACLYRR